MKSIKYYGRRKLADLLIHNDHLSLYIRGLREVPDPAGLVVRAEPGRYVHAQVRSTEQVPALVELVRPAYEAQAT